MLPTRMEFIDKNRPSAAWIAALRQRFPCEREIDRILTRKLERRAGPGYTPIPLARFASSLAALLRDELGGRYFAVDRLRWLSGGASKLQVAFDLEWEQADGSRQQAPMVIRMEPAESIVESSRRREYEIIRALAGVVPVPPVYWLDADARWFPYPAIVYGFAEGVTKPTGFTSNVSGLGIDFGPRLRGVLAPQFVDHLARLHTWDWRHAALDSLDVPAAGTTQALEWNLAWWRRVWEEDSHRDVPLMRLAACWLQDHMPVVHTVVMNHGDYRSGNFLYTEHDERISAWLDWEIGHLGDYHEDVAYVTLPYLTHVAEDGHTVLANGMLPTDDFYAAYEAATGFVLDRRVLEYYHVYHAFRAAVIVLATGYRASVNGKTHQDLLLNWIMGLGYVNMALIRKLLARVM